MWLAALLRGRFVSHPGVRLHGSVGDRRPATSDEVAIMRRRFRSVSFTRGYKKLWGHLMWVRDVSFDRAEAVRIGPMTRDLTI